MRLFAALTLSGRMLQAVWDLEKALQAAGVTGHYSEKSNLHLTLAFIGEYPDPEKAMRAVENVAFAPFRMELKGLGTFGNIIWAGVRGGEELPELAKALRRALIEDDIPCTDRAFVPHITLVRRGVWPGEALPDVEIPTADAWVDHITLMRSEQGKDGMIYTPVR